MFWGTIFSVAALISGVYYSYKHTVPDFIEIALSQREPKSQELKEWWKKSVFYRVDLRNYQDSDSDGVGDIRGLIERLPYIKELGIDAIWLSPIGAEHENFDDLIKACHQRKIKLVLDLVGNVTKDIQQKTNSWADWFVSKKVSSEYIDGYREMHQDSEKDDSVLFDESLNAVNWEEPLPDDVWPGYLSKRRKSQEKARLAAMLLLTLRGTPVLQYGEEIGLKEDEPMPWETGPFSGFSTRKPWTAISEEIESVAEQKGDYNDSLYWFYRKLIYLRQENLSLRLGEQMIEEHTHPNVLIYSRTYDGKTVWIALNMGKEVVFLRDSSDPKILLSTYQDKSDGFSLKAFEGIVWTY